MVNNWIPLSAYKLLHSPDDPEDSVMPWMRCANWFALRRVRTTFFVGALLLAGFSLSRFVELPIALQAAMPHYTNSSLPEAGDKVIWSDFAYVQYVTNANYLCNSLMMLEALHRSGAKADRIMMFPDSWTVPKDIRAGLGTESRLLVQARDLYKTKLIPIKVQSFAKGDPTWKDSYTKLLAFNQTQYKRLISLDSDAIVRDHMDELFLSPSSPVAMPRAYWLDQPFLSSQLILLEPSDFEWKRIQEFMNRDDPGFDMDILNSMYKDSCLILPHRHYNMLSAEFRGKDHVKYLGSSEEVWDGPQALKDAKFIHFSDWPVPKPWLRGSEATIAENQPKCKDSKNSRQPDCTDRDLWLGLYSDFSARRQVRTALNCDAKILAWLQQICGRSYDRKRRGSRLETSSSAIRPKYEPILV